MELRSGRRRPRRAGPLMVLLAAVSLGTAAPPRYDPPLPAYANGIVAGLDGRPVVVAARVEATHVEGTGVLATSSEPVPRAVLGGSEAAAAAAAARAWLAAGAVPGRGTRWEPMATRALLDLDLLVLDGGVAVAGWNTGYRYVWPRDAAFVAVAFCLTGRHDEALRVLQHLRAVQGDDGTWQARYVPDSSGRVPDDRGVQLDGLGWVLWAAWVWTRTAPSGDVPAGLASLLPVVVAATSAVAANTDPAHALPVPSADYWELPEREVTLGTAAAMLLAARTGADLLADLGLAVPARATAEVAYVLGDGVAAHFGRRGYPRVASRPGLDAAVAFLMPPFAPARPDVASSWRAAMDALARPGGGLTPGQAWPRDDLAWTPETAVFALTAAATGDRATAVRLLDWLDAHRTPMGSLPEKVNRLGRPAGVAPLAWTAAAVLATLAVLDGARLPVPTAFGPVGR